MATVCGLLEYYVTSSDTPSVRLSPSNAYAYLMSRRACKFS